MPKKAKIFKVSRHFVVVKRLQRLEFLRGKLKLDKPDMNMKQLYSMRRSFDRNKYRIRIDDLTCYVCNGKSQIRHHVVPLIKGGTNKWTNIVPLCNGCHTKVHPHMQNGPSKYKKTRAKQVPVLGKPKQLIVVIPPK